MHEEKRLEIANKLAAGSKEMLDEIIREAELFLESQLSSALAADSRALTLAGILAAAITLLIGVGATLVGAGQDISPAVMPGLLLIGSLIIALWLAIMAARPTTFGFRGNSPDSWLDDVESKKALKDALAEQAAFYAKDIEENTELMRKNADLVEWSLYLVFWGLVAGALLALFIIFPLG